MSNNNWKMPEPIFQRTSGSLPEDFAARISAPAKPKPVAAVPDAGDDMLSTLYAPPGEIVEQPTAHAPQLAAPGLAAPAIETQPAISEQFSVAEIDTSARVAPVKKGKGSRAILISIGLFVLLAVATGFVALIYFLFFRTPPESTF